MSTLYIITPTTGDNTINPLITILPGALNGPGGTVPGSDLRLYGQGTTLYGEGVNENLYRLSESFACPDKSELLPPGPAGVPQDATDLGIGNGINKPLTGQPWYNTTTKKLLVYDADASGFINPSAPIFGDDEPSVPIEGDLWFDATDVLLAEHQLKIYNGTAFTSVASRYLLHDGSAAMTGDLNLNNAFSIINMVDPVNLQDGATKNFVDALRTDVVTNGLLDSLYINATTNDTMVGNLTMATGQLIQFGVSPTMVLNVGNGVVTSGPDLQFTVAGLIAASTDMHIHIDSDDNTSGNFIVSKGSTSVGMQTTELFTVDNTGRIQSNNSTYELLVDGDDILPNKKYVDDLVSAIEASSNLGITPVGGIIMYSGTYSAIPANWKLCDGNFGTPNLVDKFVFGTATEVESETTGGTPDAVNISHSHTFTGNAMASHKHFVFNSDGAAGALVTNTKQAMRHSISGDANSATIFGSSTACDVANSQSVSAGTPSGSISTDGASGTGLNIPPFVKLAYIMRIT